MEYQWPDTAIATEWQFEAAMGIREYAKKKRAEAKKLYKNDPETLEKVNEAIDNILRKSA